MVRYMAALGEEEDRCKVVMDTVLAHAVAGRDTVLAARVVSDVKYESPVILFDPPSLELEQLRIEEETKEKMEEVYAKQFLEAKLDISFMVVTGEHAGTTLCKVAREHNIDCMIVGRREGVGLFQRLLTSSTSKYCVDHAYCNVLVVKHTYDEPEPPKISQEERDEKQLASEFPCPTSASLPLASAQPSVLSTSKPKWTFRKAVEMATKTLKVPKTPGNTPTTPAKAQPLDWARLCAEIRRIDAQEKLAIMAEQQEMARKNSQERSTELENVLEEEEDERADRMGRLPEEKSGTRLESNANPEKVHVAEKQERRLRLQNLDHENKRENVLARINNYEVRLRTKQLEEEERERRMREEQEVEEKQIRERNDSIIYLRGRADT